VSEKPYCLSPIKCVPKKNNKLRLVTDLRQLNSSLSPPKFKYEDIHTVSSVVESGDHMVSLDLKNGFLHIPIAERDQPFLGFAFRNKFYVWRVCPFGLNCSPYYFYKVLRPVVSFLRQQNIRVVLYVDDTLILAKASAIVDHRDFVVQTFQDLGFLINFEKSTLTPNSRIEYIGYIINSNGPDGTPWLYIGTKKLCKLKKDINRCLKLKKVIARVLAKIIGQAIAMSKAILPGKLKLRSLYAVLTKRCSWSDTLLLDESAIVDLHWWLHKVDGWNGSPLWSKPVEIQMMSDACDSGWGCVCDNHEAAGTWNADIHNKHINYKELLAIHLGLCTFANLIRNKSVQVLTDNTTSVAYVMNMGGPSRELTDVAERIWSSALDLNVSLQVKHIAGVTNTWADHLSRLLIQYEWKLQRSVFNHLDYVWGPHTLDRFASISTTQLPRYNSRYSDPRTLGVDALAQTDWAFENNFVNPPFCLLDKVLDVIIAQQAVATLIAPVWPAQPWFRKLVRHLVAPPILIPRSATTVLRMGDRTEPWKNPKWRICAWRITGELP